MLRRALTVLLVLVWGVNGLWCKVLGQVPRHEQIVARVVGEAAAPALTILIGLAELGMVVWILSGLFPRLCALAENLWSPPEARDYAGFVRRLRDAHLGRLAAAGIDFRPLTGPLPWQRRPAVAGTLWPTTTSA